MVYTLPVIARRSNWILFSPRLLVKKKLPVGSFGDQWWSHTLSSDMAVHAFPCLPVFLLGTVLLARPLNYFFKRINLPFFGACKLFSF